MIELHELIRRKYEIKNVTGLNLLPFILFDDPFDIIAHCMVGSEGTLAFISEVTMNTAAEKPYTASAMVYFDDMTEACRAVVAMRKEAPIQACELLDKKSLASVGDTTGQGLTALLIQTEADDPRFCKSRLTRPWSFSTASSSSKLHIFLPTPQKLRPGGRCVRVSSRQSAALAPLGTTALIEDVAFHIDNLPEATVALAKMIEDCGYDDACIYGHALEGNYHFVLAQKFDTQADIDKYRNLMKRIEELVVGRFDGSLKAEHGTGRNMAPFVEAEWGKKAWALMETHQGGF